MERVNQLTKKEYWLLKAIANGKSIRSICQEGAIALNTFKVHRKSLFRKNWESKAAPSYANGSPGIFGIEKL